MGPVGTSKAKVWTLQLAHWPLTCRGGQLPMGVVASRLGAALTGRSDWKHFSRRHSQGIETHTWAGDEVMATKIPSVIKVCLLTRQTHSWLLVF